MGDDVLIAGVPEEDCVCGKVNRNITDYVVGGVIVEENEYPWQVRARKLTNAFKQSKIYCFDYN